MIPVKLAAARVKLVTQRPYLAAAAWSCHFVAEPSIPTMACDERWRVYYSPEAIERWRVEETATALYHELCHLLRAHSHRAKAKCVGDANARAWNLCADAELNPLIIREGFEFPVDPVVPHKIGMREGMLAEEMFDAMQAANANAEGDGSSTGSGACDCGSGADGRPRGYERGLADDVGATSDAEAKLIRRTVAESIRKAGAGAGHWRRWADAELTPVVNWRLELACVVRSSVGAVSGMVDYSYRRPSRRQNAVPNVVLPSMYRPVPRVAVVIDTSGSMTDKDTSAALAETQGVLSAIGAENVTTYSCDDAVSSAQRVTSAKRVKLVGGGGTDLTVGIARAMTDGANVVVVITDGETPWPQTRPSARVVAVLIAPTSITPPAWIKTIQVQR